MQCALRHKDNKKNPMAEKKSGPSYTSILGDLKAGKYEPVYLLMGNESYYIDKIADYIAEHALQPEERDFNQNILYGLDVTSAQVADLCKGYPMMASRRVVIVKEAQNLRGWEPIEKYLQRPVKSTVLVICYKNGSIDGRKKVVSLTRSVGVVFESNKIKDYQLTGFISGYLKEKQATIDPKANLMIADHVGADLSRLFSELDKLLISMPDNHRHITPEMVEKEIGVSKEFNNFELQDAIINRDVFKANQIVKYFNSNPKAGSLYASLPLLFSFFQNLMIAYYCPQRNNPHALANFLNLRSEWAVKGYITGMKNYSGVKVMQIINKMREVDANSKGLDSNTNAGELMRDLIYFILH